MHINSIAEIRPSTPADAQAVHSLINVCASEGTLNHRDLPYVKEVIKNCRVYVALATETHGDTDKDIIGVAWLTPCYGWLELHIAVAGNYRRRGIGLELVKILTREKESFVALTQPKIARGLLVPCGFWKTEPKQLGEINPSLASFCSHKIVAKASKGVENIVMIKKV